MHSFSSPGSPQYDTTTTGTGIDYTSATQGEHRGVGSDTNTKSTTSDGKGTTISKKAGSPSFEHGLSDSNSMPSSSSDSETSSKDTGLAQALGEIADKYLAIDVLDHSRDASRYVGYLLDTIHSLESKLSYRGARDLANRDETATKSPDEEREVPRSQDLYKIVCSATWHDHDGLYFEDEPKYQTEATHEYKGLCGNVEVADLDYYVEKRPGIVFIVINRYECGPARRHRLNIPTVANGSNQASERKQSILIVSAALNEAIRSIAEFNPYTRGSDGIDTFLGEMEAPYLFLFHHYQQLRVLVEQGSFYRPIVDPLIQFLEENYAEEYRSAHELFQRGFVTAYHAAKLYKPFDVLVVRQKDTKSCRNRLLSQLPRMSKDRNKWSLEGWSWTYNGRVAERGAWTQETGIFRAEEYLIRELPIYPLRYAKAEEVENSRETGRRFWSMRHQGLRCYTGWDEKHDRYYSDERFMVDVATYNIMSSNRIPPRPYRHESIYDKWPRRIDSAEEMPPGCELLLPDVIEGFNLGSKKWIVLNVNDFLPQVDWNKNAFRQLVLDDKIKEMIHALIEVQKSRVKAMDDIIKGKGNGLILLLHGSPGTGKTLTAESVAEIAEKPLYRVTCGDIGTEAKEVEKYLQSVLYLGKIWDCVLLLDEADVFLEERTMADLARNSLVSVFLRVLEYHDGILILTSNRVGTFDEAFKSRIQVAIHYDNLTKKSRKAIWRNFFDMIQESNEDANMAALEGRLDDLATEEMNGRQIRNALVTARQLAQHRNERLDWEHLNQVMKTAAAFNRYLKTVKGHTDDRWAREEGIR
ncbi:hypothetical protein PG984_014253 [Apiospora sp. TS-2023a]